MADQEAADLAADVAAQADLMAALRKSKAALGAFPSIAERSGDTSLLSHFQCLEQDVVEATRAAVNTAGPGGMAALHVACLEGNAADVELLLGFGADPTAEGDVWDVPQVGERNERNGRRSRFTLQPAKGKAKGTERSWRCCWPTLGWM